MIVVEHRGVLLLHLQDRIAILLGGQEVARAVAARCQNLVLDAANRANVTVRINRAGTRHVAAVGVAAGVLVCQQGALTQLIHRAEGQHQARARAAHAVQVVLHLRRQIVALLQADAHDPAVALGRTHRVQRHRALLAVALNRHLNRRAVRGVYRLRHVFEGGDLLVPHLQEAVAALQHARCGRTLDGRVHQHLLGHLHLQVTHGRDLRLSLRISHLRAGRRRRLLMTHVRVQGVGGHHEATVAVKSQPPVESLRAGQLSVRAARHRHRGHVELAVGLIAGGARNLDDVLILVGAEHVKERAGAFLHVRAGQDKRTGQQRAGRHGAHGTQVQAALAATRSVLTAMS